MGAAQRGEPGHVLVLDLVPARPQLLDRGVQIARVPQHHRVQDQAQRAQLVLLALAVRLVDLPAPAVAQRAGQGVPRLLDGQLPVHRAPVGVVHRVHHRQQVKRLGYPAVLGERRPQRGGVPLTAEHPQQVVRADLPGRQRARHPQHVRPPRDDLPQVHLVAGDGLRRPVVRSLLAGGLGPPEPLIGQVPETRTEAVAEDLEDPEDHVGVYVDSSS
jgi:hypothetical protein